MGSSKKRKSRDSDSDASSDDSGASSSTSSSSASEDEGRRHKRERKEDKRDRKDRKEKKEKSKHKKKKKSKDKKKGKGDKDDARVAAAKEFLKQQLAGGAAPPPSATLLPPSEAKQLPSSQQITDEDYFAKGNEFMAWLQEYRQTLFNELTTEEARALFTEFVKVWNSGRLATKYYAGLVQAPMKRTSHQWSFKAGAKPSVPGGSGVTLLGHTFGGGAGAAKGMAAFLDDQKAKGVDQRDLDKLQRRRAAGEQRELLDELLPKATGRDAIAEKRIARREDAKARGASPDRAFLPGGGDMMGGDESFEAAKAREARRAETMRNRQFVKREEVAHKVAQAQAAEDEKMAQFRALLNQGPITIAKRQ